MSPKLTIRRLLFGVGLLCVLCAIVAPWILNYRANSQLNYHAKNLLELGGTFTDVPVHRDAYFKLQSKYSPPKVIAFWPDSKVTKGEVDGIRFSETLLQVLISQRTVETVYLDSRQVSMEQLEVLRRTFPGVEFNVDEQ